MSDANEIATALRRLDPESSDFRTALAEVMDALGDVPARERPFAEIFQFMERNPAADFGAPGPIVHSLEALGGYEEALLESIRRAPTPHTLWMVNRILNSDLATHQRERWLAELGRVAADLTVPTHVREEAREFLHHQGQGG